MNLDEILSRIKAKEGLEKEKDIAMLMDMKPANFSARKKSGSLFLAIAEWATKNDYDLNWLLKNERKSDEIDNELISMIQEWLKEISEKDPGRKEWFRIQFENTFPEFKKWKTRKLGGSENNSISNQKIA